MRDLYAVTIFDLSGPARFTKRVLASSEQAARELASSLWAGVIERVEFECEIDAAEPSSADSRTDLQEERSR
jgi:hypothetical protein